jgi:hypothetical protein
VNYQRFVSAAPQPPAAELQRIYDKVDGLRSLMEVKTSAVAKQVVTRQPGARADV